MYSISRKLKIDGFCSFFCADYKEGYFFGGELHHPCEVVYCLDGVAGVSFDEKIYYLHSGDIIVYPPHVHHKLWNEGKTDVKVFVFSFEGTGDLLDKIGGAYSCDNYLSDLFASIVAELQLFEGHHRTRAYLDYLLQSPLRMQMVANSCENALISLHGHGLPLGSNNSKNARDYERIIEAMKANIKNDLTVEELSFLCNISVSSMKKLFCKFNTMGIHEYFLHLKMDEAMRLLKAGRTVMETAEYLGFANSSYFSTAFKRITGVAPSHFKRNK